MTDTVRVYCNYPSTFHSKHSLSWIASFTRGPRRWLEDLVPRGGASTGDGSEEYHRTTRHLVDSSSGTIYRADYKRMPERWNAMKTAKGFSDPRTSDGARLLITYVDVATRREYADDVPAYDKVVYQFQCRCGQIAGPVLEETLLRELDGHVGQGGAAVDLYEIAKWS